MHSQRSFCDGMNRRNALRVGLGATLGGAIGLPQLAGGGIGGSRDELAGVKDDVSLIILFLQGGLSTIDTLDLKPQAPPEFRGEFSPIDSVVSGMQVCEHLPQLARTANLFSLVRNLHASQLRSRPRRSLHADWLLPASGL